MGDDKSVNCSAANPPGDVRLLRNRLWPYEYTGVCFPWAGHRVLQTVLCETDRRPPIGRLWADARLFAARFGGDPKPSPELRESWNLSGKGHSGECYNARHLPDDEFAVLLVNIKIEEAPL